MSPSLEHRSTRAATSPEDPRRPRPDRPARSAAAQRSDPERRLALTPRVGAGWNLGAYLGEAGIGAEYDLPGGFTPRAEVAGQVLLAPCAGSCDLTPWMLSAGVDYRWRRWGRRVSIGAGGGVYRFPWDGPGDLDRSESHGMAEAVAGAERGRWRIRALIRMVDGGEGASSDFQVVFSLGRRFAIR